MSKSSPELVLETTVLGGWLDQMEIRLTSALAVELRLNLGKMERVANLYGFTKQKIEEKKSSNGPPFKSFSRD